MTVTNKKDLLKLCNQIHKTTNQLQKGITGKSKRKQKNGTTVRSRKTQKRKIEVAATADALANVFYDKTLTANSVANTATRIISPMKGNNQG